MSLSVGHAQPILILACRGPVEPLRALERVELVDASRDLFGHSWKLLLHVGRRKGVHGMNSKRAVVLVVQYVQQLK